MKHFASHTRHIGDSFIITFALEQDDGLNLLVFVLFACSACACMGCLCILLCPVHFKYMHVRLGGDYMHCAWPWMQECVVSGFSVLALQWTCSLSKVYWALSAEIGSRIYYLNMITDYKYTLYGYFVIGELRCFLLSCSVQYL